MRNRRSYNTVTEYVPKRKLRPFRATPDVNRKRGFADNRSCWNDDGIPTQQIMRLMRSGVDREDGGRRMYRHVKKAKKRIQSHRYGNILKGWWMQREGS